MEAVLFYSLKDFFYLILERVFNFLLEEIDDDSKV